MILLEPSPQLVIAFIVDLPPTEHATVESPLSAVFIILLL